MMRFLHNRSNSKDSDGQFTWTKNALFEAVDKGKT